MDLYFGMFFVFDNLLDLVREEAVRVLRANVIPDPTNLLNWWSAQRIQFPHWWSLVLKVALVPVNNIPVERLFSLLRYNTPQQQAATDETL